MEFEHSQMVDRERYQTDGLCEGIDLRINNDPNGEIAGARRCQQDWSRLVGGLHDYHGTLGNPFSFMRVAVPETLPGRLEVLSYANEFAFLFDDSIVEELDKDLESDDRRQILENFASKQPSEEAREMINDKDSLRKAMGIKTMKAQVLTEMMAIDKERAVITMKSWEKFVQVVSSRQRSEPFSSLADYLPYRISDAGELFWFGLVTFGMGLSIPEHEMDLCKRLGSPSWSALALTNDLYSWPKERDAAAQSGASHVINGIWVLMKEHSLPEAEAIKLCREKIKECVAEAIRTVETTKADNKLSLDLRVYTEAILYSISGNLVWSIYCPRYQKMGLDEEKLSPASQPEIAQTA